MSTTLAAASPRSLPAPPPPGRQPGGALSPVALAEVVRRYASLLRAGALGAVRFGDPDRPGDPEARWHVRVHADDLVDVWVISWLPTQGTQLHDHGGSSGAFTVVRGALTEAVWSPRADHGRRVGGRLTDRVHPAGAAVTFGPDHVHDVRNLDAAPAVSVHAYSQPLRRMGYYAVEDDALRLTSVLDTTDPEPAL